MTDFFSTYLTRGHVVCYTLIFAALLIILTLALRKIKRLNINVGMFIYVFTVSFSSAFVFWWIFIPVLHHAIYNIWIDWFTSQDQIWFYDIIGSIIIFIATIVGLIIPETLFSVITGKRNN